MGSGHGMGDDEVTRAVLARYGTTYADEAGIRLADEPAPLFQLLVLAQLLSARIGAGVAVATARELFAAGWTTPAGCGTPAGARRPALGRGGYRRYDERTATQLRDMATWSWSGTAPTCADWPARRGRTPAGRRRSCRR